MAVAAVASSEEVPTVQAEEGAGTSADMFSAAPWQATITGLPASLCENADYLEAMWDQIGLGATVNSCVYRKGLLEVEFTDMVSASWCNLHFQSCYWQHAGAIVVTILGQFEKTIENDESIPKGNTSVDAEKDSRSEVGSEGSTEPTESPSSQSEISECMEVASLLSSQQRLQPSPSVRPYRSSSRERRPAKATARSGYALVINYIPREANAKVLTKVFSRYGNVVSTSVMRDRQGVSKCFGFVNFETHEEAALAVKSCRDSRLTMKDSSGKIWHVKATWSSSRDVEEPRRAPGASARVRQSSVQARPTVRVEPLEDAQARRAARRPVGRSKSCAPQVILNPLWSEELSDNEGDEANGDEAGDMAEGHVSQ